MRRYLSFNLDLALLVLRLALAIVLLYHGIPKLLNFSGTVAAFQSMGLPAPLVIVGFAVIAEVGGGLLLLFGVAVDVAGILVVIDMLGAILLVHLPKGFDFAKGGWEHPFTVLCMALAVALGGAGGYAVGGQRIPYRGPERRRRD
jgi:putative oxidoreductase